MGLPGTRDSRNEWRYSSRPSEIVGTLTDGRTFTLPVSIRSDYYVPSWTIDPSGVTLTGDTTQQFGGEPVSFDFIGDPGVSEVTEAVERKVWAARRDFRARDFNQAIDEVVLTSLENSRWRVRPGSPEWADGQIFVDDEQVSWVVIGTSKIGRGYLTELLAREVF